jgi:hypothetical protein
MPRSINEEILARLDQILKVMSLQVGADKSITERACLLQLAGLDNRTIAQVLNTTDATIRTLTARGSQRAATRRKSTARKKRRKSR